MRMEQMKIVVIDHSIASLKQLTELIENYGMNIVATSQHKADIMPLIEQHKPDVVLLSISLIDNDYRDYIQKITLERKIPIIVLANDSIQETAKTVFAITNGASDYIIKEKLTDAAYRDAVLQKLQCVRAGGVPAKKKHVNKIKRKPPPVMEKPKEQAQQRQTEQLQVHEQIIQKPQSKERRYAKKIVAIGTSTGGPRALQTVLRTLPKNFPAPIVIVQHMPSGFTKSLANRLNETCQIHVKEAEDGERLQNGTAYIAPGNYHMTIKHDFTVHIYKGPEILGHRPSVNVLFESLTSLTDTEKYIVVLTGMGKDGAAGLQKLKAVDEDITVLIESEETAIIFGMPRAALDTGYVNYQLKIDDIGDKLIEFIMKRGN